MVRDRVIVTMNVNRKSQVAYISLSVPMTLIDYEKGSKFSGGFPFLT